VFYPEGTPSNFFITEYAKHFSTVEIDATFYRIPTLNMVRAWKDRTPEGFQFAAKIPRIITHEKLMAEVEEELTAFLSVMENLGDKLGPVLFQFKYFKKAEFQSVKEFMDRIEPTISTLPRGFKFALEIRNKQWIKPEFLDFLRNYNIAFTLIDHPWMPYISDLVEKHDVVTTDFMYIRWLGDRYKIEEQTKSWDKIIIDRSSAMESWANAIQSIDRSGTDPIYGYFNNHYAGHAPASVRLFEQIWNAKPHK
jgi:uncharacterized protein YecE (DUF72 family)